MSAPEIPTKMTRRDFVIGLGGALAVAGTRNTSGWQLKESLLVPESSPFSDIPDLDIDFSRDFLDQAVLKTEIRPGNAGERETYTDNPDNVRVESPSLIIQAHKTSNGYTSGRLSTVHNFMYGKWETEARWPRGKGTFPAIWLQTAVAPGNGIPGSNGEIDIEAQGGRSGLIYANAYTLNSILNGNQPNQRTKDAPDMYENFHTYGIQWTPDKIEFTLDENVYHSVAKISDDHADWPYDHPFHLVLNLAMGGKWAESIDQTNGGIDDSEEANWKMEVKSIRHYPLLTSV